MIEQKSSWDSLLAQLSSAELNSIRESTDVVHTYHIQQMHKLQIRKAEYAQKTQQWIVIVLLFLSIILFEVVY